MLLKRIWQDERAFVSSTDLIFIATIVGLIALLLFLPGVVLWLPNLVYGQ